MNHKRNGRTYWAQVFSPQTWEEFLESGASVTGFREKRWSIVKKIRPGDYLLCYLARLSEWVGILAADSEPYVEANTRIFKDEIFPCRVNVKVILLLNVEHAVPIKRLTELSILKGPRWGTRFMASPFRLPSDDAVIVMREMERVAQAVGH